MAQARARGACAASRTPISNRVARPLLCAVNSTAAAHLNEQQLVCGSDVRAIQRGNSIVAHGDRPTRHDPSFAQYAAMVVQVFNDGGGGDDNSPPGKQVLCWLRLGRVLLRLF